MPRLHSANKGTSQLHSGNILPPPPTPPPAGGEPTVGVGARDNYSPSKFPFWKRIEGLRYFKVSQQFMKFAIVGVGNTLVDIGLLNLLIFWHWPVLWANTVAFIFAATNSFFLNKYWTFGDTTGKWHLQLPFYITVAAVGLGISNLFVYVGSMIWHWDVNVVKILSIGVIALWNFLAPKFLIFKK